MYRVRTAIIGGQGGPYLSTMYFGSLEPAKTAQMAVNAVGVFWNAVDGGMPTGMSWATEPEVADVDPSTGEVTALFNTTPVTALGTASSLILAPHTQALVRWRTGTFVAGREIRGRTFIPGMTSFNINAGAPTSGYTTTVNAAAAALIADANADLYVWSRRNQLPANVVAGSLWSKFAVLRSRRD